MPGRPDPSSSATCAAPSPALTAITKGPSKRRDVDAVSRRDPGIFRSICRRSSCACSRSAASTPSAGVPRRTPTAAWIAATNAALTADVAGGRFRRDLFERLNALSIQPCPPSRIVGKTCRGSSATSFASAPKSSAFAGVAVARHGGIADPDSRRVHDRPDAPAVAGKHPRAAQRRHRDRRRQSHVGPLRGSRRNDDGRSRCKGGLSRATAPLRPPRRSACRPSRRWSPRCVPVGETCARRRIDSAVRATNSIGG